MSAGRFGNHHDLKLAAACQEIGELLATTGDSDVIQASEDVTCPSAPDEAPWSYGAESSSRGQEK